MNHTLMNIVNELRELDRIADDGPWNATVFGEHHATIFYDAGVSLFQSNLGTDPTCKPANANLIAVMRNHLPEILDALEKGLKQPGDTHT